MIFLETERLLLRNLAIEDVNDLYQVLSEESVMKYIEPVFDMQKTKEFIQTAGLCKPPLVYAIVWKKLNKLIGHAIFHLYDKKAYEIGWVLNKDYWGMGVADEVTKALIMYASKQGIESCIIECDAEQFASKKIALKNGFVYEDRLGNLERYRLVL